MPPANRISARESQLIQCHQHVFGRTLRASTKTSGSIDIRFDYPSRTTEQFIRIKLKCGNPQETKGFRIQVDTDSGWTSGQLPLSMTSEVEGVLVKRLGENRVRVTILDEFGNSRGDAGADFSVVRTAAADGMPLMHNIAVKIAEGAMGAEFNRLHTIIKKGTTVPKSGSEPFLASRNFSSSDKSTLDFEVYQHVDGIEDPEHALLIGAFRLNADHLDKGEVIRRGDRIFLDWEADENGLLNCVFQIPEIRKIFNVVNMYIPAAGHKSFGGDDGYRVATDALERAHEDVETMEKALGKAVTNQASDIRKRLTRCRTEIKLSGDADTQRKAFEEARLIRQEAALTKCKPEHTKATLEAEFESFVEASSLELLPKLDETTNARFQRLAGLARDALNRGTPQAIEDARYSLNEMRAVVFSDLMRRPTFWNDFFFSVAEDRHLAVDKGKHDRLVQVGQQAISQNDLQQLRNVVWELQENMIKG